jgi:hypothetical protein
MEGEGMRGVGLIGGIPPQGVSEQGMRDLDAAMDEVPSDSPEEEGEETTRDSTDDEADTEDPWSLHQEARETLRTEGAAG